MLDLSTLVRAGDTIAWGQACGEPQSLVEALLAQAPGLPPTTWFVGINHSEGLDETLPDHVQVASYTAGGGNRRLAAADRLDVVPVHYSTLPTVLTSGPYAVDVALVLVSPPDADGIHHLGAGEDYIAAAARRARVVVAEVNPHVPCTAGSAGFLRAELTAVVESERPLAAVPPSGDITPTMTAVARRVADLVPDGATIQIGVGGLPSAILRELSGHRDLGMHSGLINDELAGLVERGVITGSRKTVDPGRHVAATVVGGPAALARCSSDPAVEIRGIDHVHDPAVLAAQHRLFAINSALEVDLTGQVNTEAIGGRYVGSIGGGVDFARGAVRSGGHSVIALGSRSRAGSTITAQLSGPASIPRADVDVVVTEHGVAHLAGVGLGERRRRLLAICHPELREAVARGASAAAPTPTTTDRR